MTLPGFFEGTGMPDPGWWEALWPDPAVVLADVGVRPGMRVADLCCGDGWFTLQLAKIANHVVAIDIDAKLLKLAEIRLGEATVVNVTYVEGDAYDIVRLVGDPVEHVFLANAFHGVPDRDRLSREVRTALKSGGLFAVVNWHARSREETTVLGVSRGPATALRMTPESTIVQIERNGFKLRSLVDVSPYHYGVTFERID